MPPKRSPIRVHTAAATANVPTKPHPLHRHRPVVTMAVGFAIILAIGAASLASSSVRKIITPGNGKQRITIDTSKWTTYTDSNTGMSFRHPEDWNVASKSSGSDHLLLITSKKEPASRMSIFSSPSGYLGFEGLPQEKATIAGYDWVKVDTTLFGLKKDDIFFTFDAGLNPASVPTFHALLKTVRVE